MTRRRWAALISAAPLAAQVTTSKPPVGAPASTEPAATPEARMQKAYSDIRQVSDTLSKIEVPMSVEPAFSFRA